MPVNPGERTPQPPVVERVAHTVSQAGRSTINSQGLWAVLGSIVGGLIAIAARGGQ